MQIKFLIKIFALCCLEIAQAQPIPKNKEDFQIKSHVTKNNVTQIHIKSDQESYFFQITTDNSVSKKSNFSSVDLIKKIDKYTYIIKDTYNSAPQGLSYCQAGKESFLRIISLKPFAKELFKTKLESCISNIELPLGDEGIKWIPEISTLFLHWISGPTTEGKEEFKIFKIPSDTLKSN